MNHLKNISLYLSCSVCITFLASCDEVGDMCTETKDGSALVSYFPDSLIAGESEEIYLNYIIENSCGDFDKIEETQIDSIVDVRLKVKYEGCNCNLEFVEDSVLYNIKQDSTGIYEYRFYLGETDYESYFLEVHL